MQHVTKSLLGDTQTTLKVKEHWNIAPAQLHSDILIQKWQVFHTERENCNKHQTTAVSRWKG